MISRHNLATEIKIRQCVQRAIVIVQNRLVNESIKRLSEEIELRDILQDIILEVATDPHESTGLNKLDTLLKNIIPVLEEAYKSLTTDQAQRDSFRAHILHAIRNALAPVDAAENATDETAPDDPPLNEQEEDKSPGVVTVDIDAPPEEKFIDINPEEKEEETDPREDFGIEGADETGRNVAYETFQKIEKQIIEAYRLLGNDEDREVFYDYLITNVKLYFDTFETDLKKKLGEPTTPEYEKEKDSLDAGAEETEADPLAGGEEEELEVELPEI